MQTLTDDVINVLSKSIDERFSDGVICSFLSGSVAEGLAYKFSDFDVYVVMEECDYDEIFVNSELGLIEITTISAGYLQRLTNVKQSSHSLSFTSVGENSLANFNSILLLHRVLTGVPIKNQHRFEEIKSSISPKEVSANLAIMHLHELEKYYANAVSHFYAGDIESSLSSLDIAFELSFDVIVALCGGTSPTKKWRIHYARKYIGTESNFFREYFNLKAGGYGNSSVTRSQYIESVSLYIQKVLDAYAGNILNISDLSKEHKKVTPVKSELCIGSLIRSPFSRVFIKQGKIFLLGPSKNAEITLKHLVVWLEIDNASNFEEICNRLNDEKNKIRKLIMDLQSLNFISIRT